MTESRTIADTWRKRLRALVVAGTLALAPLGAACGVTGEAYQPRAELPGGIDRYKVVDVITGDSLVVDMDGAEVAVRLIGIDAPAPKDPDRVRQKLGKEAQHFAKKLLKGTSVLLEFEGAAPSKDQYGRLLAYLYRYPDRLAINEELVRQGYARPVDDWLCRRRPELEAAEREAREQKRGLWQPPSTTGRAAKAKRPEMDPRLP